jgi:hypothetical protein
MRKQGQFGRHRRAAATLFTILALTIIHFSASLIVPKTILAQSLTKVRVANIGGTSDHMQVAINAGVYRKYGFDVENIQISSFGHCRSVADCR